jgi:F-type H+-transporting ATPase subunit b
MAVESTSILGSLGINWVYLIGQIINFGILIFILQRFLYKPLLTKLKERAKTVEKGVKAAEESVKQQEQLKEKQEKLLKKTHKQMSEMVDQAKEDGKKMREEIIAQGKVDAEKMIEQERGKFQDHMKKQEKELQQKMVDISTDIAKRVLQDFLQDSKSQQGILDKQLKTLAEKQL